MYSLRRHRLKVLILVVAAAVVFVSLSLFSDARPVEQLSEAELYIHTPNTVPEDVIITTEAQEAPLVIADSATTTGVTPTSANYYTYTSDTDINARFTGLLSHVYWLFERASGEGSIRSATVINTDQSFFDRQIERTTDDLSDSINDASENLEDDLSALDSRLVLAEDALADLSISAASTSVMAANLTLNGHWLSGDGDDEGVFVDDNGRVGVGTSTFPVALGLPTLSVNGSGAFYNNTNNAVTALYIASGPSAGTGFPVIGLLDQRSGGFQWNIENSRNGDGSLGFYRSGIGSRMVLSAAGNLGIGTTTPNAKLSVIGDSYITGTTTLLGSIRTNAQSDTITFVGVGAGVSNTVTGIGEEGMNNSGFGNNALSSNTTGRSNTANGKDAMFANTTGSDNTAVGRTSLFSNTSGNYNSALGVSALNSNITGTYNTASGRSTLLSNTTGSYNTADGASALRLNVTGSYNTALGYQAGYDMNTATSTGANTFLGYNTGRGIVTGINNTILGANVTGLSSTLSNNIIIADGAGNQRINVDASGNIGIGTTTPEYTIDLVGVGKVLAVRDFQNTSAGGGFIRLMHARGTPDAPLVVGSDDRLGAVVFHGYDGSSFLTNATIEARVDGVVATGSVPSSLRFFTTEVGAGSRVERMTINNSGNIGIGTTTPTSKLTVAGDLYVTGAFRDSTNSAGTAGMVLQTTGAGTEWVATSTLGISGGASFTSSAELAALLSDENGTGTVVFANSPNFVTPNLGTPSAVTLTNATGLPISTGVDGLGAGVADFLATPNSANLITAVTNETGTGQLVFNTSPTFSTQLAVPQVVGGSTVASSLTLKSTSGVGSTDFIRFLVGNNGAVEAARITTNGYFGIGTTTPNNLLQVYDLIEFDNTGFGTKLGYQAGKNLVSGAINNTFIGYQAGYSSSTASTNAADSNTGIGYQTLYSNTSAAGNVATGYQALFSNTTGTGNVATGYQALFSNTTGAINTAVGYRSLEDNTTGSNNIAMGYLSLNSNTVGTYNLGIGRESLLSNITGSYNVAIGYRAGQNLDSATSTGANTFIGYSTGLGITTGINNTILGANVTGLSSTLSNNIIIADGAGNRRINVDSSGNVGIGTTTPGSKLIVQGVSGSVDDVFRVASSTGVATLALQANGNLELPGQLISAGLNWTARSAAGDDDNWNSVTYGNGLFVAVSNVNDRVMTSSDGINWTVRSAAGNDDSWNSVTYGNGLFVAVGGGLNDRVMTSSDGINWTVRSAAGDNDSWNSVTYGNGLFVAVSSSNDRVMTSSDGINWTARSAAGNDDAWFGITYGNGLFVAVGEGVNDLVMTSPDGINWTTHSAAGDDDAWKSVTYGSGLFVAVSNVNDRVMTSSDGITWTIRSAAGNDDSWSSVTYGSGLFVAVSVTGDRVITSPDGINWTTRSAAGDNDSWTSVAYGNGSFVAVSFGSDLVMTSGKTQSNVLATNNIFQGYMNIMGDVGIGTTTPSSKLTVVGDISATGLFLGATGTAALPSFSFNADPNTGMFNQAANAIGFATNGIERIRVGASGSLDILNNGTLRFGTTPALYATSSNVYLGTNTIVSFGTNNMMLGSFAGNSADGDYNNFIGSAVGQNADGDYNNFMGYQAGITATNASYSNFVGYQAGYSADAIYSNFTGYQAGFNASGSWNDFIGHQAGLNAANATSSVIIGANAYFGGASYSASNNTVIGGGAGYFARTGADNNVLIGYQAADNLTFGANNIVIGYDVDIASAAGSNQLNIGNIIFGTGIDGTGTTLSSGNIGIGTTTPAEKLTVVGTIQSTTLLGGSTNLTTDASGNIIRDPSDARLKENVTTIENALDTVLALRGVRYEWIDKERFGDQFEIGFLAQEVDPLVPEVVQKGGEYWSLNSKNLVAVVVEAIKEVWAKVLGHEERLVELEAENEALKARLESVERELDIEEAADTNTPPPVEEVSNVEDASLEAPVVPEETVIDEGTEETIVVTDDGQENEPVPVEPEPEVVEETVTEPEPEVIVEAPASDVVSGEGG